MKQLFICMVVLASCGVASGQDSYRCVDDGLDLDLIHSDPEAFYISMDMDPRGNLYVGGRDAVYLFEANGEGGFKARRTITTLPEHTWAYSLQVAGNDLYVLTVTALYRLPNVIRDPGKVTFERLVWGIPLGHIHQGFHGMKIGPGWRTVSRVWRSTARPVSAEDQSRARVALDVSEWSRRQEDAMDWCGWCRSV